jgi:hypothetical protein
MMQSTDLPKIEADEQTKRMPAYDQWYGKASVKTQPRPKLQVAELQQGKLPFSPDRVPVVQHRLFVQKAGPDGVTGMLTRALFTWLAFTELLELRVINPIAARIATGDLGIHSSDLEFQACQIVTDEAAHALVAKDIIRQVSAATGVPYERLGWPLFLARFDAIKARTSAHCRGLIEVCFTVVSETLITGNLAQVPKDARVVSTVREVAADHARDEANHHRYFSRFFEVFWPALPVTVRGEVGPLLPELILAFIEPDLPQLRGQLRQFPDLTDADIAQMLAESYPPERLAGTARTAAAATLNLFQRTGVLADRQATEAFQAHGLLL